MSTVLDRKLLSEERPLEDPLSELLGNPVSCRPGKTFFFTESEQTCDGSSTCSEENSFFYFMNPATLQITFQFSNL